MFIFLPATLIGYHLLNCSKINITYSLTFLGIASLVFYGYWELYFLWVIGLSIIGNYAFGLWIGNPLITAKIRKIALILAISCNLLTLIIYKYLDFFITVFNKLLHLHMPTLSLVLPLGISFFTFTQIAYLVDVFSERVKEKNIIKYALFVTYFPHLIAGPILHHSEMLPQFSNKNKKDFSLDQIVLGLTIFSIGLFKKVVIADECAWIAEPIFTAVHSGVIPTIDAWGGALAYSLQIYFDFSGYCDMAMGCSWMFGIKLPFNFDAPYKSRSIIEFWQRWHITLSRFLRDYLYIALGGNRCSSVRRYANLLITMLLGGLWHGAGWTFIIWGGLHGLYLMINHGWRHWCKIYPMFVRYSKSKMHTYSSFLITQLCVVLAWVYFRSDNITVANRLVKSMFTLHRHKTITGVELLLIFIIYMACFMLPNVKKLFHRQEIGLVVYQSKSTWSLVDFNWTMTIPWAVLTSLLLLISILLILMIGDETPFLYFQF